MQQNETRKFANSIDPDEVAHNDLLHLGLHCFISGV